MAPVIPGKISRVNILCLFLILCAVAAISILAIVPPVSRDALTHHLAVPKLYLQHGGIYEIPHLKFSYYPMNLDLLYLIPLYFGNDVIPKFIHFTFALITAGMIYRYISRRINSSYALLGALFFLTIPAIVRLSSTVYVDLGLLCFLFASLLYLFRWTESDFEPKYLLISAVFSGLALGTKYNGLVGLFLLAMFCAFVYARHRAGKRLFGTRAIGWCAAFVTVALIIFSPWMIKNFAWTGNPVYPLYNSVFNTETESAETEPETVIEERDRMSHIQVRRDIYGESWAEIALIPVRVFFQGKDDTPKYFDGKTSPFLLVLPIFAFFGINRQSRQQRTEKYMMLFFSVLFLLYACAQTSIRIRYFSPILPPLVVLSMFGLHNLQADILNRTRLISGPMKKALILCIILAMLGLNASYMANRFEKDHPIAYLTGEVTRDEYIQAYLQEYASYQYANQNLSQNDKIFGLYIGNRGYYSDIPVEFSIELLQKLATRSESGIEVAEKLHEQGFTHLLVNFSLFNYWVQKYSMHEKQVLKNFFEAYTITEFSKDGYGLLSLIARQR